MGEKRVSIRTLPSGERVRHSPPEAQHPQGRMYLIRDSSPLRDMLDAQLEQDKARHEELKAVHAERIAVKKQMQQAKGLSPEKSVI